MAKKMGAGAFAFIVGIILTILSALGLSLPMAALVALFAGVIVGYLNVSSKEAVPVMVSAIAMGGGSTAMTALSQIHLGEKVLLILTAISVFAWVVAFVVGIMTFIAKAQK